MNRTDKDNGAGRRMGPLNRREFLQGSIFAGVAGVPATQGGFMGGGLLGSLDSLTSGVGFRAAVPVWPEGLEREMNLLVGFVADIPKSHGPVRLTLAASTLYRVHVNGKFCASGPARGPHGYYRIDELDITPLLRDDSNRVLIEVTGSNINSYWTMNQPSFLQAEILNGEKVLAATGGVKGFRATVLKERIQKVQRYSFQRGFLEAYRLSSLSAQRREGGWAADEEAKCVVTERKLLLPRRAAYPAYEVRRPEKRVAFGRMERLVGDVPILRPRFIANIGPKLLGYKESEFEVSPYIELQRYANAKLTAMDESYGRGNAERFGTGDFHTYDFGRLLTGFPGATVTVTKAAKFYVSFDEMLTKGDVDFKRLACANFVYYELAPGTYELESFEPYTVRFLKLIALEGELEVRSIFLRGFESSDGVRAKFECSDAGLNRIFEAGRESYRSNAVDLFTDCPSRERAGWLCDSYFTARASLRLTGNCNLEMAFLENFLLSRRFDSLPSGMLPMCYPADHYDGQYLATWPMWLVLELEEYLERSGDRTMVERFHLRMQELLKYFKSYQNKDGLLEDLNARIYIEEGDANHFTRGVNYPANMLYAAVLASLGRMYQEQELLEKAEAIREKIRQQSFDGHLFVDNALRENGVLKQTANHSEICQYYAFYFGTVTRASHPELWKRLCEEFGPDRFARKLYPEIGPADALNGRVLRMELLSQANLVEEMLKNAKAYLLYMAESTGTLWEHNEAKWSLNHAFQSHIVHVLYRDALGLVRVDSLSKKVDLHFAESGLAWAKGSVPTPEGEVSLSWKRIGKRIEYHCSAPAGYAIHVTTEGGLQIKEIAGQR